MNHRPLSLLLAVSAALTLSACVIVPASPYDHGGPYASESGPVVDAPPPQAQYEVIPAAPGIGYVWIGGYWAWQWGRHVWIGGRWAAPPGGHAWVPGYWGREYRGWRWHGGYWGRR